ncbi:MAG TPA: aldehyde dehydrogenase family protein [Terriglobales bacterium]|nr:aldehyde dehydrogenase family protein [Terriglobales bacterium]
MQTVEHKLYIGGAWVESAGGVLFGDLNPATGELIGNIHQATGEDVERAIAAAYGARTSWANTPAAQRERILLKAADIAESQTAALVDLLITETGAAVGFAHFQVHLVTDFLRAMAGECRRITGETMPMLQPGQFSFSVRRPLGVVAGIGPFNAAMFLPLKKVAMALAAGNTFVLKPSEETPIVGLKIAEIFEAAGLPAGVLNVVSGPGPDIVRQLIADPRVKLITFTGSDRVGRLLAAEAAKYFKRFVMELGGKNPFIVLKDADIDYAVDCAAFGTYIHQGQVCMASSRIIVEDAVYDEFCKKFVAKTKTVKVGDPRDPATVIGPIIRKSHCAFVDGHIEDAVAHGAKLLTGGTHEGPFYQPTVLAEVTPKMKVYHEETFAPVTSIIRVRDADQALEVANDTSYGLSSSVMTRDIDTALKFAERLEAGMVHINDCTLHDEPTAPFGGVKNSGFGRENGRCGIEEMTEVKWITIQQGKRPFPF